MKCTILGGGAAGFFAAITCKENFPDATVTIFEKSLSVLNKVKISGGGRCNVTHACFDPKNLVQFYPRGNKELLGAFHRFQPQDTMEWFSLKGATLKIEKDNRVFPVSNNSQTIIDVLVDTAQALGVVVHMGLGVRSINYESAQSCFVLALNNGQYYETDRLLLATGSSSQGHAFAESLGHSVVSPVPSLFTFSIQDEALRALSGLSVSQVRVALKDLPKQSQEGPLLVTHWGMSGPAVLRLSAWQARVLYERGYRSECTVNWLPQHHAIKNKLAQHDKKAIGTKSPFSELPTRLWCYFLNKHGISLTTPWQQLSSTQRDKLSAALQSDVYLISGKGIFKDEFVTCGGVSLSEVDFRTMKSKCCPGLFFAGEILDVDGITGGFNFQNAWTTGFIAGRSMGV